jgi:hypothetical protein
MTRIGGYRHVQIAGQDFDESLPGEVECDKL